MSAEFSRIEFVRIKIEIPVKYKFVSSKMADKYLDETYSGMTLNISQKGMLIVGPIPDLTWLADLLRHELLINVNFVLPLREYVIKVLTEVLWVGRMEEPTLGPLRLQMGLRFKEISSVDSDKILQFIVKSQMSR